MVMPHLHWEEKESYCQMAAVLALGVGHYHHREGRRCGIVLSTNYNGNNWLWLAEAGYFNVGRQGVANSLEAAKEAAIAALPDIWNDLRNLTIKELQQGENEPPKEPHLI